MSVVPYPEYKNQPSLWAFEGQEPLESVDRNRTTKRIIKVGATAGNIGFSGAQFGTGTSSIALITGAAAASATGIGLIVGGGLLTVGSAVYAARSAYKSYQHRNVLQKLADQGDSKPCQKIPVYDRGHPGLHMLLPRNRRQHDVVFNQVLPYLIDQKDTKFKRKVVSSVPGVGLLETVRAVGKKAYKFAAGSLGQERKNAAEWLAVHLITHDCALAQAIVAEVYSFEEMLLLLTYDTDKLIPLLMDKMKST